jgi:hypothetical protein
MATIEDLEKRVVALETKVNTWSGGIGTLSVGGTSQPKEIDPLASTSPAPVVAPASVIYAEPPIEFKHVSELTEEEKKQIEEEQEAQEVHAAAQAGAVPAEPEDKTKEEVDKETSATTRTPTTFTPTARTTTPRPAQ